MAISLSVGPSVGDMVDCHSFATHSRTHSLPDRALGVTLTMEVSPGDPLNLIKRESRSSAQRAGDRECKMCEECVHHRCETDIGKDMP